MQKYILGFSCEIWYFLNHLAIYKLKHLIFVSFCFRFWHSKTSIKKKKHTQTFYFYYVYSHITVPCLVFSLSSQASMFSSFSFSIHQLLTLFLIIHKCGGDYKGSILLSHVAASRWIFHFIYVYGIYLANVGRQENIVFCRWKMEWESPPSILVTRNPNWSQRSSTGTGCIKRRY
jgi:hypothetical protein